MNACEAACRDFTFGPDWECWRVTFSRRLLTVGAGLCALFLAGAGSVSAAPLWRDQNEGALRAALSPARAASARRGVVPTAYRTLEIDLPAMRARLAAAPRERVATLAEGGVEITLPLPYGGFGRFLVLESPIMEEGLAARYPELKTFVAQGVDDPSATARLDLSPQGFRAYVLSARGQFVIDPYWQDDDSLCISYYLRHAAPPSQPWTCGVQEGDRSIFPGREARQPQRPTGASLRTYRLAVGATGEYSAAVAGTALPSKAGTLSAVVTIINRVNAIYERDLALRFVLVANTDALIFLDPATDGYSNFAQSTLLNENQGKCDTLIGSANYDVGHVFDTLSTGLAFVGAACLNGSKAKGASGRGTLGTDAFAVKIVAHELGHQLGAAHSFNGLFGSCAPARVAGSAYEVGSGSTIMGYAGVCGSANLQATTDDYLHTTTYEAQDNLIAGSGACAAVVATGNSPPVIAALTSRVIPARTPFALTASASDADGDTLTYCWEECDLGPGQDPTESPRDNGSAPLFRSFEPSLSPVRIFPSLTYILNNANVPPATVGGFASGEFLPTTTRTLTFRVTVRDNRAGGGGSDYAQLTVQSVDTGAAFAITSQNTAATIAAGTPFNVTWQVAGTTGNGINCANVDILYSTDGGLTFPVTLAAGVANNGSRSVTIPNVASSATTLGRLQVRASDNIFFDLNDANLTVTTSNSAPTLSLTAPTVTVSRGAAAAVVANVGTASDANGHALSISLAGVPFGATVTPSLAAGTVSISAQASCACDAGGPLTLTVTDSLGATTTGTINLVVTANPAPTVGNFLAAVNVPRGGVRILSPNAAPADANGNLGASPFRVQPETLPGGGTVSVDAAGAVTVAPGPAATLGPTTIYVTVQDQCGAAATRSFDLNVTAATGPLATALSPAAPSAESCGPGNGFVDPGELVTISLPLRNDGSTPLGSLVATLQAGGGLKPVGAGTQMYGAIAQGQTVARDFTFIANGPCGATVQVALQLQDGATDLGLASFPLVLGGRVPATFALERFDSVTPPALPAGWTSTVVSGPVGPWTTTSVNPDSAPNCAINLNPNGSAAETRLDSPPILLTPGTNQLRFRQAVFLATSGLSAFDAAVLEVSLEGGPFLDIQGVGGVFTAGGYTHTVSPSALGPIAAGRGCWSGTQSYFTSQVTLPAEYSGREVRFRFRLAWYASNFTTGLNWRIDTIDLLGTAPDCCSAAPQFVSSAPATPVVVGVPYVHTFVATGNPTFALSGGALPPGLSLSPGGVLAGTPSSAGTGFFPNVTVTASNGLPGDASQTFSLSAVTRVASYLAGFGLSGPEALLTADPNADGVFNLLAYALGLNPTLPRAQFLPVAAIQNYAGVPYASLTFQRSSVATDLTYFVEASGDLQSWNVIATSIGGAPTTGPGFVQETGSAPTFQVEVRDTVPVDPPTGGPRFLRLRITTP